MYPMPKRKAHALAEMQMLPTGKLTSLVSGYENKALYFHEGESHANSSGKAPAENVGTLSASDPRNR